MQKVISITTFCPLWKEPSYKKEMISQLLFGEQAYILEEDRNFTHVRCVDDGYEGWCMNNQLAEIPVNAGFELKGYINETGAIAEINESIIHLPVASPVYTDLNFGSYKIKYPAQKMVQMPDIKASESTALRLAMLFLNTPYLWGGKSSFGMDCSGFTQQVFKLMGIALPRDAYQQVTTGETVDFLQQARCGDLAYFDNEQGDIIHVGMLMNSNAIIHASGYVRVDAIDHLGIINTITGKRSHSLRIIKRMF